MTLFDYGVFCGILLMLIFYVVYVVIYNFKRRNYYHYYFSMTALEFDLIRSLPVQLVNGMIYTEKCKKKDLPANMDWGDSAYLGYYPESAEEERELSLSQGEEE